MIIGFWLIVIQFLIAGPPHLGKICELKHKKIWEILFITQIDFNRS